MDPVSLLTPRARNARNHRDVEAGVLGARPVPRTSHPEEVCHTWPWLSWQRVGANPDGAVCLFGVGGSECPQLNSTWLLVCVESRLSQTPGFKCGQLTALRSLPSPISYFINNVPVQS